MSKYLVVDSSFLAYRSYFAYGNLTNKKNQPTGAIFGYAKTIFQLVNKLAPDYLVICKDLQTPTFRHEALEEYKGNRKPMEDNMQSQMSLIEDFSNMITKNNFSYEGYEADDVIYSVVNKYSNDTNEFYILSGDKDLFQLFTFDRVSFVKEEKEFVTVFRREDFVTKYSLQPVQWVDYKALIGDGSDNFAGVPGVGPVSALKILHGCGSLHTLITALKMDSKPFNPCSIDNSVQEFITNPKNEALITKIKENYKTLVLSYKLSKLALCEYSNIPLEESFTFEKSLPLLEELDMHGLVKYYNTNFGIKLIQEELF
jgi:DNA polymerase I